MPVMAHRTTRVVRASVSLLCVAWALWPQSFTTPKAPVPRASREPRLLRRAEGGEGAPKSRYDAPDDLTAPVLCERSSSGLAWQVLEKGGKGTPPLLADTVIVRYTGWKAEDGSLIDSSYLRQETTKVKMTSVIPGWKEGLMMMSPGEKRRFWIPASLGFVVDDDMDPEEAPGPPGDLIYDVEFVGVTEPEADPIFVYVAGAGVVLFALTALFTAVNEEPERPEYDTQAPFSIFERPDK